MTPKLAAIKQQLGLLQSDVDKESEKVLNQIEAARARTQNVFAGTREKVAKAMQGVQDQVDEVNSFLDGLEQTNGGPILDGSQGSSETTAAPGEPAASWSGNKPA